MADGALQGRRANQAYAAHTDGSATTVVTLTLPDVEGYYRINADAWGGSATGTNKMVSKVHALATVESSAASITSSTEISNVGGTGYTCAIVAVSGLQIALQVTAASGQKSGGFIESRGFELAITPA